MSSPSVESTLRVAPPTGDVSTKERLHIERHLTAYDYALKNMPSSDIVLDVACGFGVGIRRVLESATTTVAMDLAKSALASVADLPGLTRIQANACQLPVASDSVDSVLAFQLIEHVARGGAVEMLREFQRVIKPGGVAFVTTPNARWRLLPFQKPWNPYHVKEYRPSEIARLCEDAQLEDYEILGLQGKYGAHETELKRVRQDPLAVYLKLPSRYRWYIRKLRNLKRPLRDKDGPSVTIDDGPLYEFDQNYSAGIDFMVIIRKATPHSA